jgi:hypothetical protein
LALRQATEDYLTSCNRRIEGQDRELSCINRHKRAHKGAQLRNQHRFRKELVFT